MSITPSSRKLPILQDGDLLRVQKPAQYIGGELNSVVKDDAGVDVHVALCFPDTYEVGMSHVGLQILYAILNDDPRTWAERMYMPMADMELLMRERGLPLCSLESKRPMREFDIVGFSLQYELCGTNILAMLERGGLAFYACDRGDEDPVVIGGGPYAYHPEALAPFFDAFFLGDAEEGILELVQSIREQRTGGRISKRAVLERMRGIEGVYLPGDYVPRHDAGGALRGVDPAPGVPPAVVRRLLPTLEGVPYPKRPIVPNIQTVHNRLSIEVMRGCVRGCRFCQAGYLYRPQRERSPEEIREMLGEMLPTTGYEELSLLSLSTADYCSIVPLLKNLMDSYAAGDQLAISFPSTRVDALTPEVLEQVQRVRRTGFTVAPEAGTQRLRDVINKGVSDEQILETCGNVFRMGWSGIKLYFMLGLPTETDDDLQGIVDIASRVKRLPEARGKDITVSVSTMVPKPHTPFQWAEQISVEETLRRQRFLAERLRRVGVTFRCHDAFSSFLEGVFCRAGRELAPAVVRAYELGCRLDAWQEHLREEVWLRAFQECNIDPTFYLRAIDAAEALPWDHLSCGIPKSYFLKEWRRAVRAKETPDCLTASCSTCGACDYDQRRNILWPRAEAEEQLAATGTPSDVGEREPVERLRIRYRKQGPYRFVGHLELVSVLHRAARRASLPLAFSRGFHPMPRLSFGPPLQLGIESDEEYVDAIFTEAVGPAKLLETLNDVLPPGLTVAGAEFLPLRGSSLHEAIAGHRFRAEWHGALPGGLLGDVLAAGAEGDASPLTAATVVRRKANERGKRSQAGSERTFVLTEYLSELTITCSSSEGDEPGPAAAAEFVLRVDCREACPKPTEVIAAWTAGETLGDYRLTKLETIFRPECADGGRRNDALRAVPPLREGTGTAWPIENAPQEGA